MCFVRPSIGTHKAKSPRCVRMRVCVYACVFMCVCVCVCVSVFRAGVAARASVESGAAEARHGANCVCVLQVSRVEQQLSVAQQQHDKELKGKSDQLGTQFTCFTGTKVQILTQEALQLNTSHA